MLIDNTMKKILAIGLFLGYSLGNINAQTVVVDVCDQNEPWNTGGAGTGLYEAIQSLSGTGGTVSFAGLSCPAGIDATPNELKIISINPPAPIIIDATTYTGGGKLQISGPTWGSAFFLQNSSNIEIRGFNMYNSRGVELDNADNNVIAGNCIGTDNTGNALAPSQNGTYGIWLRNGSSNNVIGGTNDTDRNVIVWYERRVSIEGSSNFNTIENNYLGIGIDGSTVISNANNAENGIHINNSNNDTIRGNIISNTERNAINIENNSLRTVIEENVIGFDVTGTLSIANGGTPLNFNDPERYHGININGSNFTRIRKNLIGNSIAGEGIILENSSSTTILGNVIGLDSTGLVVAGNRGHGILVYGGTGNTIGGTSTDDRNIISGNGNATNVTPPNSNEFILGHGIELRESNNNYVWGNWVGLDITGNNTIGNHLNGIYIQNGSNNQIGGTTSAHRNVVGGNGFAHTLTGTPQSPQFSRHGIQTDGNWWTGGPANNNTIQNNWLGVGVDGTTNVRNSGDGISVYRRSIQTKVLNNVCVYNLEGIFIQTNSDQTEVYGNYAGLLPDGITAVGNINDGIKIHSGDANIIGGTTPGEENYTVGNGGNGIQLTYGGEGHISYPNEATTNTIIQNNIIGHDGTNPTWSNGAAGILINQGSSNNTIGGTGTNESNLIANNGGNGIDISGLTSDDNTIVGNEIYCNAGRGIELNDEGNDNYASTGSSGSAELYVNTASTANYYFGISPANARIDIYELGICNTCTDTDNGTQQGATWLATVNADASGDWVWNDPGTHNITVTATDATGATSEFSQCVTICSDPGAATLNVSPSNTICQGETVNFTATAANAGTWQYTFFRGATQVQQSTSNTLNNVSIAGSYTVQINDASFPSNTTCQSTSSPITLTVNSVPSTGSITPAGDVCEGDVVTYTATGSGATYDWSTTTGSLDTPDGSSTMDIDFTGASSGTISVIIESAQGCQSTPATLDVTVNPTPNPTSISGPTSVCRNDLEQYSIIGGTAGSNYNWTVTGATQVTADGTDVTSIDVNFAGASSNVTVSVIETSAANCPASTPLSTNVNVHSLPMLTGITPTSAVCEGDTVNYTANSSGTSGFTWSNITGGSVIGSSTDQMITINWNTSGPTGHLEVNEVTGNGCTLASNVTRDITINAAPTAGSLSGDDPVCEGTSHVYTSTAPGGTTNLWSVSGASFTDNGNTANVNFTGASGTVDISVVAIDNTTSCQSLTPESMTVTVNPTPGTLSISGNNPIVCDSDNEIFTVSGSSGGTLVWGYPSDATVNSQGATTIDLNMGTSTLPSVTVTETTAAGCSGPTASFAVNLDGCGINANFSANTDSICEGDQVTFTDASTGTIDSYSWDFGNGATPPSISGIGPHTVTYNTAGQSTVSLTVTEGVANDTETKTNYITVHPLPSTNAINGSTNVCEGTINEVFNIPGANPTSTYTWSIPGATFTSGTPGTVTVVNWGTFTGGNITVTEQTDKGCLGTPQVLNVTIDPAASLTDFSPDTEVCEGDLVTYTSNSTSSTGHNWVVSSEGTIQGGSTSNSIDVLWGSGSSGTVSVQETTADGCISDSIGKTIVINALPTTSAIGGPLTVCEGDQEDYSVTGSAGSTFTWSTPTNSTIVSTPVNADLVTVDFSGATSGTISVIETTGAGCSDPASAPSISVTVNPQTDDAGPISGPAGVACDGNSGSTYTFSIDPLTNVTGYSWTVPTGASIDVDNGTNIEVDFGTATGNRTVTVTPNGLCGDGNSSTFNIDIEATVTPSLDILADKNGVCGNELITFEAFPSGGGTSPTFIWYLNGLEVQNGNSEFFARTFTNGDSVSAVLISDMNCTTSDSATNNNSVILSIQETPVAEAGPDHVLTNPETIILTTTEYQLGTTSGSGISYNWSSSVDDLELSVTNPTNLLTLIQANPTEAQTWYYLTVTNSLNCNAMDSLLVAINFEVFIPSGFSPNNDGNNDKFQIHNIDKYPGNRIEIYNRWGSLVYEAENYGITGELWDGTINGKDLPMATYYYIVHLNDGSDQQAGPVTIVK